jgi:hypothetical protein
MAAERRDPNRNPGRLGDKYESCSLRSQDLSAAKVAKNAKKRKKVTAPSALEFRHPGRPVCHWYKQAISVWMELPLFF